MRLSIINCSSNCSVSNHLEELLSVKLPRYRDCTPDCEEKKIWIKLYPFLRNDKTIWLIYQKSSRRVMFQEYIPGIIVEKNKRSSGSSLRILTGIQKIACCSQNSLLRDRLISPLDQFAEINSCTLIFSGGLRLFELSRNFTSSIAARASLMESLSSPCRQQRRFGYRIITQVG